jgi:Flp pilus assembly protein TadD
VLEHLHSDMGNESCFEDTRVQSLSREDARLLMLKFASLGDNCEFGAAQRAFGAEPVDLFRWGATDATVLLELLQRRFADIGDLSQIEVQLDPSGQYMVIHRSYNFMWHAWVREGEMTAEAIRARESRRLPFLSRKITEELQDSSRIFVVKPGRQRLITEAWANKVLGAMRSFSGNPTLLYVTEGSEEPKVERVHQNLLHGYIPKFANVEAVMDTVAANDWLSICHCTTDYIDADTRDLRAHNRTRVIDPKPTLPRSGSTTALEAKEHAESAQILAKENRTNEAIAEIKHAINLEPENIQHERVLGHLLATAGDYGGSEAAFRRALALKAGAPELHAALAHTLAAQGSCERAIDAMKRAIALDPTTPSFHLGLAHLLARIGTFEEAEQAFRNAVALDPDLAEASAALGHLLSRQGRIEEASLSTSPANSRGVVSQVERQPGAILNESPGPKVGQQPRMIRVMINIGTREAIRNRQSNRPASIWSTPFQPTSYPEGEALGYESVEPGNGGERVYNDRIMLRLAPKFRIPRSASFFTAGSCFAREIEWALFHHGARVNSWNPSRTLTNDLFHRYNTFSIINDFAFASGRAYDERYVFKVGEDKYCDFTSYGVWPSVEDALKARREVIDIYRGWRESDVIILTLGLVEAWFDRVNESYLNVTPYALFHKEADRFELRITGYPENYAALKDLITFIISENSATKVILTVSPVPFSDTFSGQDVVIANTYSKSVLRAVAQDLASEFDGVDYFPSYEIVMLSAPDKVWLPDRRHVDREHVGFVVQQFERAYMVE